MSTKIITSFFTKNGTPQVALNPLPTIRIWEVGVDEDILVVQDQEMVEVGDGFYKYVFQQYDPTKEYLLLMQGNDTLQGTEKYLATATESYRVEIARQVWESEATDFLNTGTMGAYQNQIRADVQQLRLSADDANILIGLLLKYSQNRTKVDKNAKTLTVYDNDGTTPIRVFELKDSTGAPSTAEVVERRPI